MNKYCEKSFLLSAMSSELWAASHIKKFFNIGNINNLSFDREKVTNQIEDELSHSRSLEGILLIKGSYALRKEPRAGMQEILYKNIAGIIPPSIEYKDEEYFWDYHEIMEKRAIWIYKTVVRVTSCPIIKIVLNKIIKEEAGHINNKLSGNFRTKQLIQADEWLFKEYIPKEYGTLNLLDCDKFWEDYWQKLVDESIWN